MTFKELGLSETTLKALEEKGFEEPTQIQAACIPLLLKKHMDVVGQAQTGTGKTAAFGLPILETVDTSLKKVQALILTPTRELAIQVAEEIDSLKGKRRLEIASVYGGQSIGLQIGRLKRGVHIVVGTPGRVQDHLSRGTLTLDALSFAVLDEADEMLNMGFIDDIKNILTFTPEEKRMLLFSATMPSQIMQLAQNYMRTYERVVIEKKHLTTDLTDQIYFEVNESDKFEALTRIIDMEQDFYGLVFCRTKTGTDDVVKRLQSRGYDAEGLHGDISQNLREKILEKFREKIVRILVATDVAARGIDIQDLTHVINFSLPQDPESYIHRIGRTGRAGKEGTAVTFITPAEYRKLSYISKATRSEIRREALPGVKQLIGMKKERIKEDIIAAIERGDHTNYADFITELTEHYDAYDLASALFTLSYGAELDESAYQEIRTPGRQQQRRPDGRESVDRKGKTRLFVAKGRKDQMSKADIVQYITHHSGVPGKFIHEVQLFELYSFVNVSFEDAEVILRAFQHKNKGGNRKPIVVKAKPMTNKRS